MDYSALDDAALMAAIAGLFSKSCSDTALNEAVSALYDRYGRLIYSVAIRIVGDVETAEEITQDVFIRACEGAASYNTVFSKVSNWMVSIARHRAIDELRRRSVRPEKQAVILSDDFKMDPPGGQPSSDGLEDEVEISMEEQKIHLVVNSCRQTSARYWNWPILKACPITKLQNYLANHLEPSNPACAWVCRNCGMH